MIIIIKMLVILILIRTILVTVVYRSEGFRNGMFVSYGLGAVSVPSARASAQCQDPVPGN